MADYIRRDLAKKRFSKRLMWLKEDVHDEYSGALLDGCEADIELLDEIPAADVAEVVHGEWLRSDDDWNSLTTIQCSICGEEWCFETDDDVSLLNYKYCPNCGAKMDGGNDNATN